MDIPIVPKKSTESKRTPNCKCVVCDKPMYRRPNELAKFRHVACMEHRAEAQKLSGVTDAQQSGLALGRVKGTNHLKGRPQSEKAKRSHSEAMAQWCKDNPEKAKARATKGEKHYNWKGGNSNLNIAIRQLTENRKWMDAVKARDGKCVRCGSADNLESHHIILLIDLLKKYNVKTVEDARNTPELWNIDNGETLCQKCHYDEHERAYPESAEVREYKRKEKKERKHFSSKIAKSCAHCGATFLEKPSVVDRRIYCSRKCVNDSRRKSIQANAITPEGAI
jgi:5-methylcytosine-specific restriction endonuclease McrA